MVAVAAIDRARDAMNEIPDAPRQMEELEKMSVGQLADLFRDLYGEPTRTRNKTYLRKRLMWRLQEISEGGLSTRARARIDELGEEFPERWRMRQAALTLAPESPKDALKDARLPPPGALIEKQIGDTVHRVLVLDGGEFEYEGERFQSLSGIAKRITGTNWNGYSFFGLKTSAKKRGS
jgi:hypothetical protein